VTSAPHSITPQVQNEISEQDYARHSDEPDWLTNRVGVGCMGRKI